MLALCGILPKPETICSDSFLSKIHQSLLSVSWCYWEFALMKSIEFQPGIEYIFPTSAGEADDVRTGWIYNTTQPRILTELKCGGHIPLTNQAELQATSQWFRYWKCNVEMENKLNYNLLRPL